MFWRSSSSSNTLHWLWRWQSIVFKHCVFICKYKGVSSFSFMRCLPHCTHSTLHRICAYSYSYSYPLQSVHCCYLFSFSAPFIYSEATFWAMHCLDWKKCGRSASCRLASLNAEWSWCTLVHLDVVVRVEELALACLLDRYEERGEERRGRGDVTSRRENSLSFLFSRS